MRKTVRYSHKYACASFVASTWRLPRTQWDRENDALVAFAIDGDAVSFVCPKQRLVERPNWSVEWRADQRHACVLFADNPQPIFPLFVGFGFGVDDAGADLRKVEVCGLIH